MGKDSAGTGTDVCCLVGGVVVLLVDRRRRRRVPPERRHRGQLHPVGRRRQRRRRRQAVGWRPWLTRPHPRREVGGNGRENGRRRRQRQHRDLFLCAGRPQVKYFRGNGQRGRSARDSSGRSRRGRRRAGRRRRFGYHAGRVAPPELLNYSKEESWIYKLVANNNIIIRPHNRDMVGM